MLADAGDGKAAPAVLVRGYVSKAFAKRLPEVKDGMRRLAASLEPEIRTATSP